MLQVNADGTAVHMPKTPDVFRFDEEVSRIFPDMAKRAIPMYHEAHRAHVAMLAPFLHEQRRSILDVGASRGAFFTHLRDGLGEETYTQNLALSAVEESIPMLNYLHREFPEVAACHDDIASPLDGGQHWRTMSYDVVVLYYVLQFVPVEYQPAALRRVLHAVAPGGYFVFGHKAALSGPLGDMAQDEYLRFRARNGYSAEEIAAKTRALKGSMFQIGDEAIRRMVLDEGFVIQDTCRWMAFNSFIAQKV